MFAGGLWGKRHMGIIGIMFLEEGPPSLFVGHTSLLLLLAILCWTFGTEYFI